MRDGFVEISSGQARDERLNDSRFFHVNDVRAKIVNLVHRLQTQAPYTTWCTNSLTATR